MTQPPQQQIIQLLTKAGDGHQSAAEQLLPLVYDELRALAKSMFRHERPDQTLQPTALVHEAYARLVKPVDGTIKPALWAGRAHFFAVAAKAMRQILSNHARDRRTAKRGGGWQRVTLSATTMPTHGTDIDLVSLDEALSEMARLDDRQARIVELRFFGEMSTEEIAHVLGVSISTVEREWRMARAWLGARLCETGSMERGEERS